MSDLVLDPQIRSWVFLPTIVVTFVVGIFRHYLSFLLEDPPRVELQQLIDSQMIIRASALRENCKYIPKSSFLTRKKFFNNEETGCLKQKRLPPVNKNPFTDSSRLSDMIKGNISHVLPTIVVGSLINLVFSGFITTKVPFPLTLHFKSMLQSGIDLNQLDPSWVSSASWYFLNVFGLRSLYSLVLGENNGADHARKIQDQIMSGAALSMPLDPNIIFKSEWEALEIVEHKWNLTDNYKFFYVDTNTEQTCVLV